jgi:hypothetical protein
MFSQSVTGRAGSCDAQKEQDGPASEGDEFVRTDSGKSGLLYHMRD